MDLTLLIVAAIAFVAGGVSVFLWTRYNDANHPGKNARYDEELAEARAEVERLRAKARTQVESFTNRQP